MKRFFAAGLCILMLCSMGALASEQGMNDFSAFDGIAIPSIEYRIRLPERAPDAREKTAVEIEGNGSVIDIDAAVCDFGRTSAAVYRATPPDIDALRLISFFWPQGDASEILSAGEIIDGVETYAHAGGRLRLSRQTGEVSFLADAERADSVGVLYHPNLGIDPTELADAQGSIADPEAVNAWARDFLAIFGIGEEPLLLAGYGMREKYADRAYSTETFDFAVVRDGLPFCNRTYLENPDGGREIPAQHLVVSFDEHGVADLSATVFQLEPVGEPEEILPYLSMLDDLKEGEGFLWWGGRTPIASITLEYMLVPAGGEADSYICRPAWRFHESARAWEIAWAYGGNVYAYDALTAALINF